MEAMVVFRAHRERKITKPQGKVDGTYRASHRCRQRLTDGMPFFWQMPKGQPMRPPLPQRAKPLW